jgi:hypothetical protein
MSRPIAVRYLHILPVAVAGVLISYTALGQHAGQDRIALRIDAELTGARSQSSGQSSDLGDQSITCRSADYNPAKFRRDVLALMRRSAGFAYADNDKSSGAYIYIAGGGGPDLLFRQAGDGRFHNITRSALAGSPAQSLSAVFSDYDHSGKPSLFLAGIDGVTLYRNNGRNSFSEATREAGIASVPGVLCTSAVLGDLDGDGFPDLLVTAYTDVNRPPAKSVFTFPNDFTGTDSRLYRNNGNGTFTEVTESSLGKNPGRARKAIVADFNGDGRLDIVLLRDNKPPALYLNRGGWRFEDVTWDAGDDLTAYAFFEAAVADFNQDGKPDLALWSTHIFRLLINEGNATFEQWKSAAIPDPVVSLFGFRGAIADCDGDGFDDLITLDGGGRLRAFLNHSGVFREAPLEIPQSVSESYLAPIRLKKSQSILSFRRDGSVALLEISRPGLKR